MTRRPQPLRIVLEGVESVALSVGEYEQLLASRRQVGGQSARLRALGEKIRRTDQLLSDLRGLVDKPVEADDAESLRTAVAALLDRHRDTSA
ncbi:hypothetical protein [Streptomyces sp. SID9124]|uniref:hypothetical protein n=1 Tax=Streptomyces sp. SID9124 TaxID=2706108 RepID=UPI0019425F09|nr:hypothetical protein [Streptomyces sp. SID9124]